MRHESTPDVLKFPCPPVWASSEDIVWKNVVIAKGGHDWDDEAVKGVLRIDLASLAKDLYEFVDHVSVEIGYLFVVPWVVFVIVVSRGVTCPDHKINVISYIFGDPVECGINEGERRIAFCGLGAEVASRPIA